MIRITVKGKDCEMVPLRVARDSGVLRGTKKLITMADLYCLVGDRDAKFCLSDGDSQRCLLYSDDSLRAAIKFGFSPTATLLTIEAWVGDALR